MTMTEARWSRLPPAIAAADPLELDFARVLDAAAARKGLRKGARTRLRLLAAIAALLALDRGEGALRVADVTRRAGVAHGTFYRYFPDSRTGVEATIWEFAAFLHLRLSGAAVGMAGTRMRVRAAMLAYARLFRANPGLMRCLVSLRRDEGGFRAAFHKLNQDWNARMALALAKRRLGPECTHQALRAAADTLLPTAYALGGMVDEFLAQVHLREDPCLADFRDDPEAIADLLTDLWCRAACDPAHCRLAPNAPEAARVGADGASGKRPDGW